MLFRSGKAGGYIVATGTPEEVANFKDSETGKFLAPVLGKSKAGDRRHNINSDSERL